MRLRRQRSDAPDPADLPPPPPDAASFDMNTVGLSPEPDVAPHRHGSEPAPADITSVGVAILPGVPLPPWVPTTATVAPEQAWAAPPPAGVAYAAPAMAPPAGPPAPPPPTAAPVAPPPTPVAAPPPAAAAPPPAMAPPAPAVPAPAVAAPAVPAPAVAAPAAPAAPLPPPDPATWSQHPLGPVVWGAPVAAPAPVEPPAQPPVPAPPLETQTTTALDPITATPEPAAEVPAYATAPPPTGPAHPDPAAPAADAATQKGGALRWIIIVGVILIAAALLAFAAFVTPGFLASSSPTDPTAGPVATPAAVAGFVRAPQVADPPAATFQAMAATVGAATDSHMATYTADGVTVSVWLAPATGTDPRSLAQAYEQAGGSVGSLTAAAAGARGGEMACGAASKTQTTCFWTGPNAEGVADVTGVKAAKAATLLATMRETWESA